MSPSALKLISVLIKYSNKKKIKSSALNDFIIFFPFSMKFPSIDPNKDNRVLKKISIFSYIRKLFPMLLIFFHHFILIWILPSSLIILKKENFQLVQRSEFEVTTLLFLLAILLITQLIIPFWHWYRLFPRAIAGDGGVRENHICSMTAGGKPIFLVWSS